MSQRYQYTTVDTILSKFHRDFRGSDVNESDAIEWIGEALGFMQVANMQEEAVAFIEIKNYQCALPNGLHNVIQVARNNGVKEEVCPATVTDDLTGGTTDEPCPIAVDCQGNLIGAAEIAYYRPYFDLQYEYLGWAQSSYRQQKFTPVRLADHTFFNTLVCQENDQDIYSSCGDEYTIIGDQLRFSFKDGLIALAYLRQMIDDNTGYPKVPDDISVITAINYYLIWKMKERESWSGREGAFALANNAEAKWLKYVQQAKNKAMMPQTVDDYQDLMEQSRYLIPRFNRYYGFFGKLNEKESRPFKDPDHRNNSNYLNRGSY